MTKHKIHHLTSYNIIRNTNGLNRLNFQNGGKIITINAKTIELHFEHVLNTDNESIYLTDISQDDMYNDKSCIIIHINRKEKAAEITSLSSENNLKCYESDIFEVKKPGKFYMETTIKMLKKYKDKFNINKIIVSDRAFIRCNKFNINFSEYLFFTTGQTFYGKYDFTLVDKDNKEKENKNIKKINKLLIKDINFDKIIEKSIKFDKKYNNLLKKKSS